MAQKEIESVGGEIVLVDDVDYEHLSQFNWYVEHGNRECSNVFRYQRFSTTRIPMPNEILGLMSNLEIKHKDGNGLNNRLSNLRFAPRALQNAFLGLRRKKTSKYKGVSKGALTKKKGQRWQATITKNGEARYLGYFGSEEEAARAYDAAARETWGDVARLNFPAIEVEPEPIIETEQISGVYLNIDGTWWVTLDNKCQGRYATEGDANKVFDWLLRDY